MPMVSFKFMRFKMCFELSDYPVIFVISELS